MHSTIATIASAAAEAAISAVANASFMDTDAALLDASFMDMDHPMSPMNVDIDVDVDVDHPMSPMNADHSMIFPSVDMSESTTFANASVDNPTTFPSVDVGMGPVSPMDVSESTTFTNVSMDVDMSSSVVASNTAERRARIRRTVLDKDVRLPRQGVNTELARTLYLPELNNMRVADLVRDYTNPETALSTSQMHPRIWAFVQTMHTRVQSFTLRDRTSLQHIPAEQLSHLDDCTNPFNITLLMVMGRPDVSKSIPQKGAGNVFDPFTCELDPSVAWEAAVQSPTSSDNLVALCFSDALSAGTHFYVAFQHDELAQSWHTHALAQIARDSAGDLTNHYGSGFTTNTSDLSGDGLTTDNFSGDGLSSALGEDLSSGSSGDLSNSGDDDDAFEPVPVANLGTFYLSPWHLRRHTAIASSVGNTELEATRPEDPCIVLGFSSSTRDFYSRRFTRTDARNDVDPPMTMNEYNLKKPHSMIAHTPLCLSAFFVRDYIGTTSGFCPSVATRDTRHVLSMYIARSPRNTRTYGSGDLRFLTIGTGREISSPPRPISSSAAAAAAALCLALSSSSSSSPRASSSSATTQNDSSSSSPSTRYDSFVFGPICYTELLVWKASNHPWPGRLNNEQHATLQRRWHMCVQHLYVKLGGPVLQDFSRTDTRPSEAPATLAAFMSVMRLITSSETLNDFWHAARCTGIANRLFSTHGPRRHAPSTHTSTTTHLTNPRRRGRTGKRRPNHRRRGRTGTKKQRTAPPPPSPSFSRSTSVSTPSIMPFGAPDL